jgi:hypothetical protein
MEIRRVLLPGSLQRGDRTFERGEAYALRLKADTAERDRSYAPGEADRPYAEALGIADSLRMRPLAAHCHLGLGTLYRCTGKREQAEKHFTTATTMYREMGMTYWLEQAEAELK